ncbi:unnamed protein product [Lactuca virosa]|uniref:Uncharacterized protein n=1 Tax=Lactuca virosa TaxID=75947 RepID=A0AAU9PG26_9ASTR|nr:unnamed protein product [Lactuca virosa]
MMRRNHLKKEKASEEEESCKKEEEPSKEEKPTEESASEEESSKKEEPMQPPPSFRPYRSNLGATVLCMNTPRKKIPRPLPQKISLKPAPDSLSALKKTQISSRNPYRFTNILQECRNDKVIPSRYEVDELSQAHPPIPLTIEPTYSTVPLFLVRSSRLGHQIR